MARTTGRDPVSRRPMMDGITAITSDRTGGTTYQARWTWTDPAGKRIFGAKIFRSLDDAERHLLETMLAIRRGAYGPDDTTLLADYAERWLSRMEHRWASSTTAMRRLSWRGKVQPRLGSVRITAITRAHCQAMVDELVRDGFRRGTVDAHLATLHGILGAAVMDGLIARNPASRLVLPRRDAVSQTVWTAGQVQAFLAGTAGSRHHMLWSLLLMTGMRIGEALALTWSDIDLDTGVVHVHATIRTGADGGSMVGQGTKTGEDRHIPITPVTVDLLRRLRQRQRGQAVVDIRSYVFAAPNGQPINRRTAGSAWALAVRRHGLPAMNLHGCRHTAATLMVDGGVSPRVVQDILGHARVAITLERYTHVDLRMLRAAVDRYETLLDTTTPPSILPETGRSV